MNLDSIPVIDTHCHPFAPAQTEISAQWLRDAISVSLRGESSPMNDTMMLSRMMIRWLARVLECEPTWDAVIAARNALAITDVRAYHQLLFSDAKIAMVLIDPGFPAEPTILAQDFAPVMPCPVFEGYRIERFIQHNPFDGGQFASLPDYIDAFRATLDAEATKPSTRYFKSIIGYATGLAIRKVDEARALGAWKAYEHPRDTADKTLRDYMFWVTALKAREHQIPFQMHTGHTSLTNLWPDVNPILLTPLLNEPDMQEVPFVLVHSGYPYCTEAGYLTSVYPNICLDISLMIPWSSIGVAHHIEQILEAAPTAKMMYGSDGIYVPELYWISAKMGRRALGKVLDRLVAEDVLDDEEAVDIARDIFYRNAERVYHVSMEEPS